MNSHTDQHPRIGGALTLFSFVNQLRFRPRTGHLRHWGGNDLFFWRSPPLPWILTLIPATLSSSHHRCNQSVPRKSVTPYSGPRNMEKIGQAKKLGHKDVWHLKMGHGTKKVENPCSSFPYWRDTATDESVTQSLWLKQLFSKLQYIEILYHQQDFCLKSCLFCIWRIKFFSATRSIWQGYAVCASLHCLWTCYCFEFLYCVRWFKNDNLFDKKKQHINRKAWICSIGAYFSLFFQLPS